MMKSPSIIWKQLDKALAIIRFRLIITAAYRFELFMMLISGVIISVLNIFLMRAIFEARVEIQGFSVDEIIKYALVASAMLFLNSERISREIHHQVREGMIFQDLIKPVDYLQYIILGQLARYIFVLGMVFLPQLLVFSMIIFPGLSFSASQLGAFLLFTLIGFFINCMFGYLTGMFAFVYNSNMSLVQLKMILVFYLSGLVFPFDFFPPLIRDVLNFLPTRFITYIPTMLFIGKPLEIGPLLITGFSWCLGLWLLGKFFGEWARCRLEIQGG